MICSKERRFFTAVVILTSISLSLLHWGPTWNDVRNQISNFTIIQNTYAHLVARSDNKIAKPSHRHFLYLTQTESCLSDYLLGPGFFGNGSKREIVVLSWKQPCPSKSSRDLEHIEYFYNNDTTWSKGRNALYSLAKKLPNDYLYYIFMDDDLKFSFTSGSFKERYRSLSIHWPLQAFEYFLLNHEPALALPVFCLNKAQRTCEGWVVSLAPPLDYFPATIWFDAALNAFHKNAIDLLLPYRLDLEHVGWWHSQKYVILAADLMFRGQILKFVPVSMVNLQHRKYPRGDSDNWAHIYDVLKGEIPKKYRDRVKWTPKEKNINFKPIVKNNTVITPMWTFKIPLGKIEVEPFKHFKP